MTSVETSSDTKVESPDDGSSQEVSAVDSLKVKDESMIQSAEDGPSNNNNNNVDDNSNNNNGDAEDSRDYNNDDELHDDATDNQNGAKNESMDDEEKTNLIVNYLPQQMTDDEFKKLFEKYGNMKSCKIVRNRMTGYSYGFGFVDYDTHEQALKAIEGLNGHEVEAKKIKVAFARPAGQDIKQANLYVKNVPNSWSQEDVKKVFEPYGQIIQVRVLGNDRGVAFVLFDLRKQAQEAMEALNGKQVEGCDAPLEIKFAADKKGEKRGGNKSAGGVVAAVGDKPPRRRERGQRGGRNRDRNRGHSNQGRSTSQGRGNNSNSGGRVFNKGNNNNNNSSYHDNMNGGGVGPMRPQQVNRMSRYTPFVPMQQQQQQQQQPIAPQPTATPINPYGYPQQPIMPYMMANQAMMQMNPMAAHQQSIQMANAYSMGQIGAIGYAQPPAMAQQPSAAVSNMYNVASNMMNNAAQMQPQLGQPMNMRGTGGGQTIGGGTNSGGSSAGGGGSSSDGVTLFVYNIGPSSDENELKSMFSAYGEVLRSNVVRKTPGGETKGFGFVTMRTRSQAETAISVLNGQMRNGKTLQVSFKK